MPTLLRRFTAVAFLLAAHLGTAAAQPEELPPPPSADDPPPTTSQRAARRPLAAPEPARPTHQTISDHYVELTMGFIGGGRHYSDATFASQDGVAPNLTEPFNRSPFSGVNAFGLRYDLRVIVSYVRMTVGVDIPFPSYRVQDTQAAYLVDGMMHNVSVQSLHPYEMRFGIGGEYPIWVFAPFVDLLGTAYWANASLAVDNTKADSQAQGFGFSLRGGCRVHLKSWFFTQVSADVGLYGPVAWNAELSIGFAIGRHQFKD